MPHPNQPQLAPFCSQVMKCIVEVISDTLSKPSPMPVSKECFETLRMNNAITEIKSTLEGTNRRITDAEDRISEVEDRMVEINEAERKNIKELKEMRKTSETSGTVPNTPTFES